MTDRIAPKPRLWPFLLSDLLLLALATLILYQSPWPPPLWPSLAAFLCVATGAWLCVVPFVFEHRAALRLIEADGLASALTQMQHLEQIQAGVASATNQWQSVQDQCSKAVLAAQNIANQMAAETKEFMEFLEKADATEKNHLRLEVEKLRRSENDWLQVSVRLFDHIYALNLAAHRSGHAPIINQLSQFQFACRDVARRVGLIPFEAQVNQPFDANLHQLLDTQSAAPGAPITETLATGFTFQGQLLRRAVVAVDSPQPQPQPQPEPANALNNSPELNQPLHEPPVAPQTDSPNRNPAQTQLSL